MSAAERIDRAQPLRRALVDVRRVCAALGLEKGAMGQRGGLIVCCPSHGEKNASCSVTLGQDGTIRVKCFACDLAGDVFTLIGAAKNLDPRRDFSEVLDEAERISGMSFDPVSDVRAKPIAAEKRDYPLESEVASVWQRAASVTSRDDVSLWLTSRGLDQELIASQDLARAIPNGVSLPWWASYKGAAEESRSWGELGHVLLFPVYDHMGRLRSLRAGRVVDGESPKRLPPAGHASKGLVLANKRALAVIGHGAKYDVLIVEGEPDFLTWASAPVAVFGVGSGSWTRDHARRIPAGSKVVIRTHQDPAGDKYAEEIGRTLVRQCTLLRPASDGLGDENDRLRAGRLANSFDEGAEAFTVETVDPRSFFLGRLFADYYWLGDELRPGVFAARCPAENLHAEGERFDGRTVVKAPERRGGGGSFRCSHDVCRGLYDSNDVIGNAVQRVALSEGL